MKEININIEYSENNNEVKAKIFDCLKVLSECTEVKIEESFKNKYTLVFTSSESSDHSENCVYCFESKKEFDFLCNFVERKINQPYEPDIDELLTFNNIIEYFDIVLEMCNVQNYKKFITKKISNHTDININNFKCLVI